MASQSVRVWDPFVRVFHWLTASLFLGNYLLSDEDLWLEGGSRLHRWVGYSLAGLVIARVLWGFIGSHHARFRNFVPSLGQLQAYIRELRRGRHPYYLGHNPAGALMILFLLVGLLATALSGWLLTLERFHDQGWLEGLHGLLANSLMAAVVVHVLAVLLVSLKTRDKLVRAMLTGKKTPPSNHPGS